MYGVRKKSKEIVVARAAPNAKDAPRLGVPKRMEHGGPVKGKGGPTDDSVPILASKGEFMVKAKAVQKLGLPFMHKINAVADHPDKEGKADEKGESNDRGVPKRGPQRLALGGPVIDPNQIPADGYPKVQRYEPVTGTDMTRNIGNAASALGPAAGAAARGVLGFGNLGVAAVNAAPSVVPKIAGVGVGAGMVAGSSAGEGEAQPSVSTFSAPAPAPIPVAGPALAATTPGAGAGRGFVNPSSVNPDGPAASNAPITTGVPGAPKVNKTIAGGRTLYSDQSSADNEAFLARGPMSAQNQAAMSGIQGRQDANDARLGVKAQLERETADAAATNLAGGFATGAKLEPRDVLMARLGVGKLTAKGGQVLAELSQQDAARAQNRDKLALDSVKTQSELKLNDARTASLGIEGVSKLQMARLRNQIENGTPEERQRATQTMLAWEGKQAGSKMTEDQGKSAGYAARMDNALRLIGEIGKTNPGATRPGVGTAMVNALPEGAANMLRSADRQRVEAAQLDALDAALTLNTGAAYTKEQLQGMSRSYFAQPGDDAQTVADKKQRLQSLSDTARLRAGPTGSAMADSVVQRAGAGQAQEEPPQLPELRRRAASNPQLAEQLKAMGY